MWGDGQWYPDASGAYFYYDEGGKKIYYQEEPSYGQQDYSEDQFAYTATREARSSVMPTGGNRMSMNVRPTISVKDAQRASTHISAPKSPVQTVQQ